MDLYSKIFFRLADKRIKAFCACIHMKDALFVPNAPRIPTPLGEGQMDYTILRDWLHREHPDAALLRDEVILSAAQRDLNFIRAM